MTTRRGAGGECSRYGRTVREGRARGVSGRPGWGIGGYTGRCEVHQANNYTNDMERAMKVST